jgi:hypothetical protein
VRFVQFDVRNHIVRRLAMQFPLRLLAKLPPFLKAAISRRMRFSNTTTENVFTATGASTNCPSSRWNCAKINCRFCNWSWTNDLAQSYSSNPRGTYAV